MPETFPDEKSNASFFKKLRKKILPVDEKDSDLKRISKNTAFIIFLVMFITVSLLIILAITIAL